MLRDAKTFSSFSVNDTATVKSFYADTLRLKVNEQPAGLGLELAGGGSVFIYPKGEAHAPATFTVLNFQVSKIFDNGMEIYSGVKNILNFTPKDPILNWQDPSSPYFDTTYNYAPMQGIKGFAGVRFTIQ